LPWIVLTLSGNVLIILLQCLSTRAVPNIHFVFASYADDLTLMAESEESLRDKIVKWKSGLEAKGLKMNTGKTKVMFSCSMKDRVKEKGKWPCGVCKKSWQ